MSRAAPLVLAVVVSSGLGTAAKAQQVPDLEFDTKVVRPAYTDRHPSVLVDEAHDNFHTAGGRYKPFADLVGNDGYAVRPGREKFSAGALKGADVLVVVNAQGAPLPRSPEAANPAFTPAEVDAVREWVRAGGSLLLIADHHPWGPSNEPMAAGLGVEVGRSTTIDPVNSEPGTPGVLVFTRENGLIGDHPILKGRDGSERVDRVLAFAGQSLKGPEGSAALLILSKSAVDQSRPVAPGRSGSAAGRAQGLAFALGKGRVVVLGEAAMLSAQVNGQNRKAIGMNVPGTENRQLALNIMHWLSGLDFNVPGAPLAVAAAPAVMVRPEGPARPLSPAEIAAESEPSIARISGERGGGTGFLVAPGVILTNSHVIDGDFASSLKVRFPSAEAAQQGPLPAELVFEDARRDLAFLRVKSILPPLRVARSYTYRKGEDVTVIGNPGLDGEQVLENAISRGVMSSKTTLDGLRYYQLGIAVNPGNSGGPVFDSTGRVIGVVTRKTTAQEALAFAIPAEDLNLALEKVAILPQDAIDRARSRHRLVLAAKGLGTAGVFYSLGRSIRSRGGLGGGPRNGIAGPYESALAQLEKQTLPKLAAEVDAVRADPLVPPEVRETIGKLAVNLDKLKALYKGGNANLAAGETFTSLKGRHRTWLVEVCKPLEIEVPEGILDALEDVTAPAAETPKKSAARP